MAVGWGKSGAFELPVQAGYDPISMEFVWIEPGTFWMGSPDSEPDRHRSERPLHEVEISRGFWLGKYEVTQGQWEAVMGSKPAGHEGVSHPVVNVSFYDVQEFIVKLNEAGRLGCVSVAFGGGVGVCVSGGGLRLGGRLGTTRFDWGSMRGM